MAISSLSLLGFVSAGKGMNKNKPKFTVKDSQSNSPIIIEVLLMPKYDITLSVPYTNTAPIRNPIATGIKAYSPLAPYEPIKNKFIEQKFPQTPSNFKVPEFSANSIAGASSDQNDAAIMTPAAKPRAASKDFL
jgi:hypothetical protein